MLEGLTSICGNKLLFCKLVGGMHSPSKILSLKIRERTPPSSVRPPICVVIFFLFLRKERAGYGGTHL